MNMSSRVLFSSFNPLTLRRAGRLAPEVPCAILTWPRQFIPLRKAWLAPLVRHEARHPEIAQVSAKMVAMCHRAGRIVSVWVVNAPEDMERMAALGVDGIFTDVPDVALSLLARGSRAMGHVAV
ncbi:MAG: glycerophosphodiester phosphodiesterase [Anaerolineales bacterium]|jgi:glycerophosphoryl diester phosphodiesterase